jgi:hypothetical protein
MALAAMPVPRTPIFVGLGFQSGVGFLRFFMLKIGSQPARPWRLRVPAASESPAMLAANERLEDRCERVGNRRI